MLCRIADHVDRFNREVKEAEKKVDYDKTFKSLTADILNNTCNKENKKHLEDFEKAAEGPRHITAAESVHKDMHVPCAIGGKITILFLRKGQVSHYETTLKEIVARPITPEQKVEEMSWTDVRGLIQTHEWNLLRAANLDGAKELLPPDIKAFVPVHEDTRALLKDHTLNCLKVTL